jgi:arsenate reductase-like glutaredoxin family protein
LQKKFDLELRDLNREPFTAAELDALIGERDYRLFLNPRNELYRARNMKVRPPARAEAIRLMAQEPNLIRRPMVIRGDTIVFGYDEDALKKL